MELIERQPGIEILIMRKIANLKLEMKGKFHEMKLQMFLEEHKLKIDILNNGKNFIL